jgi:exosortase
MVRGELPDNVVGGSFGVASNVAVPPGVESPLRKHVVFLSFLVVSAVLDWSSLRAWAQLSLHNYQYSHLILIPLASGALVYWERRRIFALKRRDGRIPGIVLLIVALCLFITGWRQWIPLSSTDHISMMMLSLVLAWMGAFAACYGIRSFRSAAFPLLFLLLMVPFPNFLLSRVVVGLQNGSAVVTSMIFKLVGVPAYRNGLIFALPGFRIEIATECSGIRSSIALLITALLASHVFLRSYWRKALLIAFIVPLVVVKNGLRIATLSLLSVYVNRGFLTGNLHHYGGIPFSIISVGILLPVLWCLQKSEGRITLEAMRDTDSSNSKRETRSQRGGSLLSSVSKQLSHSHRS